MRFTPVVAVLALAAAGCSSSAKPSAQAPAPTPATTTTTNPNAFECATITHAYTVWQEDNGNALSYQQTADAEKTLENAVSGYSDKPSLSLAVAVTKLGFDAQLASASESFGSTPDSTTVQSVKDDVAAIAPAYQAFLSATCA